MTHPFHLLFGQELDVLDRRSFLDRECVDLEVEPGRVARLDVAWTSLGPTDPFVARSAGRSLLHVAKLARLCELVAAMRERVDSDGA